MTDFFKTICRSKKSKARLGEIKTSHGTIQTPAFVAVGTKGTVKALTSDMVKQTGTKVAFVNTYHLVTHPGADIIKKAGGIHQYCGFDIPLMSDSGGFQVFSLASNRRKANVRAEEEPLLVKISPDGVRFRSVFDGKLIEFTPEKSMQYQEEIGADINMAFDECTYYPATHEYAKKAMERTHEWLKRCIDYRKRHRVFSTASPLEGDIKRLTQKRVSCLAINQYLYGVIQGATYEDLRKESARFVVSQNTPGVAIGGVSVGETKKEMREQVKWVSDYLPADRPVHLLGVGQIDDIVDLVRYGIDTFDCVEPTRLARMGTLYQLGGIQHHVFSTASPQRGRKRLSQKQVFSSSENIDINKSIFKNNLEKVDVDCDCYVCRNYTKSYLHHLFKQKEILGYTLATYHNLWVMEKLFASVRTGIKQGKI